MNFKHQALTLLCGLILATPVLAAPPASLLNSPVEASYLVNQFKTSDLYGAWGITALEGDGEPYAFTLIQILLPNQKGLFVTRIQDRKTKQEEGSSQYFTWDFNQQTQMFTVHTHQIVSTKTGQPTQIEAVDLIEDGPISLYKDGKTPIAIKLQDTDPKIILLKIDDQTVPELFKQAEQGRQR